MYMCSCCGGGGEGGEENHRLPSGGPPHALHWTTCDVSALDPRASLNTRSAVSASASAANAALGPAAVVVPSAVLQALPLPAGHTILGVFPAFPHRRYLTVTARRTADDESAEEEEEEEENEDGSNVNGTAAPVGGWNERLSSLSLFE